jgi:hypothetical protein
MKFFITFLLFLQLAYGTHVPSSAPSAAPSGRPLHNVTSHSPTNSGTAEPSRAPTQGPTVSPSNGATNNTRNPSTNPTSAPTLRPQTVAPTTSPTFTPTTSPSTSPPTASPTFSPTVSPSTSPPTTSPTLAPTFAPTLEPTTSAPTVSPTNAPVVRACRPREGLTRQICDNLILHCARYGVVMQWRHAEPRIKKLKGRPPRCHKVRTKASGCQCANYCGYKTQQGCNRDEGCEWRWLESQQEFLLADRRCSERRGQCYYKTGEPGYAMSQCR